MVMLTLRDKLDYAHISHAANLLSILASATVEEFRSLTRKTEPKPEPEPEPDPDADLEKLLTALEGVPAPGLSAEVLASDIGMDEDRVAVVLSDPDARNLTRSWTLNDDFRHYDLSPAGRTWLQVRRGGALDRTSPPPAKKVMPKRSGDAWKKRVLAAIAWLSEHPESTIDQIAAGLGCTKGQLGNACRRGSSGRLWSRSVSFRMQDSGFVGRSARLYTAKKQ